MPELQKPTSIKFTADEVKKQSAKERYTPGWYRWLVTNAETKLSGPGSFMVACTVSPLEDIEDPNSIFKRIKVTHNIILPKANPDAENHEAPNTIGLCHSFLMPLYPDEIQDYPRFSEGALRFNGEEIEKAEEEAYREIVTKQVHDKLEQLWEDPSPLVDEVFYAEGFQNGDFYNLKGFNVNLPDGKKLVPKGKFITKGESTEAATANGSSWGPKGANGKTNGTNGHGKTAAKPVAKPLGKKK